MTLGRHIQDLGEGFASRRQRTAFLVSLGLIAFLYPFGLAFVAGGLLPERFSWTASVVIALNGIVVLLSELRSVPARKAVGSFGFLVGTLFIVEYVGSKTGVPFGSYAYTDTLGLSILGVPPVIAIAWYGTVVCGWRIAQGAMRWGGVWLVAALTGVLAVALDVVLEPVAADVERYWVWEGGRVPLQNYASWFVFTVLAVLLLDRFSTRAASLPKGLIASAVLIFGMQWTLFVLTNLANGMVIPVLVSTLLLGMVAVVARLRRGRPAERHAQ